MNLTYEQRQELNSLSKRAFGSSSRWQKLVNDGYPELMTRQREAVIPSKNGLVRKTFTDKKHVKKRLTVDEVRDYMVKLLEENSTPTVNSAPSAQSAEPVNTGLQGSVTVSDFPEGTTIE